MFLDRSKRQHKRLPELATQPNFDDSFMESGARTARVLHLIVVLRTDDLTGSPQFRGASNRSPSLLRKFRIACIGGSAGATDIYSDILRDLSSDSGLAVIVVPHRGMRDPSRLVRLLRLATSMSVVSIDDGLPLSPNSIFVCPPGFHLSLDGLTLYLQAWRTWGWPTTLSCFLNSLAGNGGPPSAAVIVTQKRSPPTFSTGRKTAQTFALSPMPRLLRLLCNNASNFWWCSDISIALRSSGVFMVPNTTRLPAAS